LFLLLPFHWLAPTTNGGYFLHQFCLHQFFRTKILAFLHQNFCFLHQNFCFFLHQNFCFFTPIFYSKFGNLEKGFLKKIVVKKLMWKNWCKKVRLPRMSHFGTKTQIQVSKKNVRIGSNISIISNHTFTSNCLLNIKIILQQTIRKID